MGIFGAENVYFEVQNNKIAEQDRANEGSCGSRASSAGRWSARPTSTTCAARTTTPIRRCCAFRPSRRSPSRSCASTPTSSFEEPRGDGRVVRGLARGDADDARDRRALRRRAGAGQDAAAHFRAGRREPGPHLRTLTEAGLRERYGDPPPAEAVERLEMELGVIGRHGLRVLLPDRLGLRQVREGQRHRGRPGPWFGGRLDRLLLASASPTSTRSRTT